MILRRGKFRRLRRQFCRVARAAGHRCLLAGLLTLAAISGGCAQPQAALPPPQKPPVEFLGAWGKHGSEPGQLDAPVALATDSFGMAYLADGGSRLIQKFSSAGHPLLSFQYSSLRTPSALALDSGGAIYAADLTAHRVFIFSPVGDFLRSQSRTGTTDLRSPLALAVDADGNLFVVDSQRNEVAMFDARGRLRKFWGKRGERPGEFRGPSGIALGPDGSLYVSDTLNARVQKFTRDGGFVAAWTGAPPAGPPLKSPGSIAAGDSFVVAFDPLPPRLFFWTPGGELRLVEDVSAQMAVPNGSAPRAIVALAGKDDLLLLDAVAARVLRFRVRF